MNERIKELADRAGIKVFTHINTIATDKNHLAKFTELLIKECIQVSGPEDSYTDEWFKAKSDSVAKIKQHFGVEESSENAVDRILSTVRTRG